MIEGRHGVETVRLSAPLMQCIDRARYAAASLAVAAPGLDLLDELTLGADLPTRRPLQTATSTPDGSTNRKRRTHARKPKRSQNIPLL